MADMTSINSPFNYRTFKEGSKSSLMRFLPFCETKINCIKI